MTNSSMKYRVLGITSGLGVSLHPFKKNCIGNLEPRSVFHTPGNEQWKANFGDIPLWKKPAELEHLELKPNVIISSPDCGAGSVFRLSRAKKLGDHKNNHSLALFITSIRKYKPKFFLFENLDALFKSFPEKEFDQLMQAYYLVKHTVSVAAFGNSQISRKRLVIVGIKKNQGMTQEYWNSAFKIPTSLHQPKLCGELYGDLYSTTINLTGVYREEIDEVISIHARRRMSLKDIRLEWLHRLKGKKRWTVEGGNFSTAPGVYRNLDKDYPATARKANRQFDDNGMTLTPRHLARVQGVPDNFLIYIDPARVKYWINKGRTAMTKTPPYEISVWFKARLNRHFKNQK